MKLNIGIEQDLNISTLFAEFADTLSPAIGAGVPQILIHHTPAGLTASITNNGPGILNIYDVSFKICNKQCRPDGNMGDESFFAYAVNKGVDIYQGEKESFCCGPNLKAKVQLEISEDSEDKNTSYLSILRLFLYAPYCVLYVAPSLTLNNKMTAFRVKLNDVTAQNFGIEKNKTVVNLES